MGERVIQGFVGFMTHIIWLEQYYLTKSVCSYALASNIVTLQLLLD